MKNVKSSLYIDTKQDIPGELTEEYFQKVVAAVTEDYRLPLQIELICVDDDLMQSLNATYRSQDKVTDVLSFPLGPEHGQMFIAFPYVTNQAASLEHPIMHELLFLIIHGLLHLAGMDHETDEKYQEMMSMTEEIISRLEAEKNE